MERSGTPGEYSEGGVGQSSGGDISYSASVVMVKCDGGEFSKGAGAVVNERLS